MQQSELDVRRRELRAKAIEWVRRYLPLEVAGWAGLLGSAAVTYAYTGSLATAALAATIGSTVGYYLPAYVNAFRWTWPTVQGRSLLVRVLITNLLTVRSLTVEFGVAEVIDSVLIRPALIFAAPVLLGHVWAGWIIGGFLADIAFYACTIFSYERFGRWLARRPEPTFEPEPVLP